MQNAVVIIIISGITNVGIIGFHHFDCTLQHISQNFRTEMIQLFPLKNLKVL